MRSEERSGIIFITLLLLWGTLIAEPFHYFARIIGDFVLAMGEKAGLASEGKLSALIVSVVLLLITIGLLQLSKTGASSYFAPFFASLCTVTYLVRCLISKDIHLKDALVLIIPVILIVLVMLLKLERIWIWLSDIYILAIPMRLISIWLINPVVLKITKGTGEFLFFNYNTGDYASIYNGFVTLPGIVWGIFFAILLMLPVIYFVFGRRKA